MEAPVAQAATLTCVTWLLRGAGGIKSSNLQITRMFLTISLHIFISPFALSFRSHSPLPFQQAAPADKVA
jgi:hypothetical protein